MLTTGRRTAHKPGGKKRGVAPMRLGIRHQESAEEQSTPRSNRFNPMLSQPT